MKLISMTDFITEIGNAENQVSYKKDLAVIYNYCIFLKQPLELWMFFPCDENGNVLEKMNPYQDNYHIYEKAKERVLFENNDLDLETINYHIKQNRTVEYFISLKLTPTAIKNIGL